MLNIVFYFFNKKEGVMREVRGERIPLNEWHEKDWTKPGPAATGHCKTYNGENGD